MTEELCRAKFEEWLRSTGKQPRYDVKRGYWEIWQAAWNTRAEMEKSDD
jgi:hypothetical protein